MPVSAGTAASRRPRAADLLAVGAGAALMLALVLPWYARRPFWFDELVSLEIAGLGPRSFLDYVATVEANMALYHAVLGLWTVPGETVAGVRALSILFALATLPFLYALAQRLFDRRTAVTAVLLMSVNVSFVGHTRDARGYALALLLATASWYLLVRSVESSRRRDWALYAVTGALAAWAHLLAGLVVAAQLAWLLLERRTVPLRRTLGAAAALGVLLLPLALAVVVGGQQAQLDWLPRPALRKLPGLFEWFVESHAALLVYAIGGAAALAGAFDEWRRRAGRAPRVYTMLLLWLGLPPVVAFLLSFAQPVYLYRYFLVCLPALVLLVAAGLGRLRPAWLGVALTAAALALSVRTVVSCQPDCKIRHDDWRAATSYLAAHSRRTDAIVVYPAQVRTPLDHYLPPARPRLLYPERWSLVGAASEGSTDVDAAMGAIGAQRRVWLVTWWLPSERAHEAVARDATLTSAREFHGNVHVELYRVRGRGR